MDRAEATRALIDAGTDPAHPCGADRAAFLRACRDGPTRRLAAFLACGAPAQGPDAPIAAAAEGGSLERILLLTAWGADLDGADRDGETALHLAAAWNHTALVRQLIAVGANPQIANGKGDTPLTIAIRERHAPTARALLQGGADPNFGDADLPTAIALEVPELLHLLLLHGADPESDAEGRAALMAATIRSQPRSIRLLMAFGAVDRPNRHGWTAWMVATATGDRACVEALEAGGATPSDLSFYAVIRGARTGDFDLMRRALDRGHPVDVRDWTGVTALGWAAVDRREHLAAWLIGQGADLAAVDDDGHGCLAYAAGARDPSFVDFLLAAGAPANERPDRSQSLLLACSAAPDIVRRLIAAGAAISGRDPKGATPLFLAATHGAVEVVGMLLAAGADPDEPDRDGTPPLVAASARGRLACVELLLAGGAAVDARDPQGRTALIAVCDAPSTDRSAAIARALLTAGADPVAVRPDRTDTPLASARANANVPCVDVLTTALTTAFVDRFRTEGGFDAAAAAQAADPEVLSALIEAGCDRQVEAMLSAGLPPQLLTAGPRPPLRAALARADPRLANALLDAGADATRDLDGQTALMIAAAAGGASPPRCALIARLVAAGVDPNALAPADNATAMAKAAAVGDVDAMAALHAGGATVDVIGAGRTPLHEAIGAGQGAAVRWLLDRGADREIRGPDGATALSLALSRLAPLAPLIAGENGVETRDASGRSLLLQAVMRGDVVRAKALLAAGADPLHPDPEARTPRTSAAHRRAVAPLFGERFAPLSMPALPDPPIAFRELHRGVLSPRVVDGIPLDQTDTRDDTLLHHAARRGHLRLLIALLRAGADPRATNAEEETPWSLAIVHGDTPNLTEEIVAWGGEVSFEARARTVLHTDRFFEAMRSGDLARVALLLRAGVVPRDALNRRHTPLSVAIGQRDLEMVELLVDLGADIEARSARGTALCEAAWVGEVAIAEALLDAGASLEPAAASASPLQIAAARGHSELSRRPGDAGPDDLDTLYFDLAEEA